FSTFSVQEAIERLEAASIANARLNSMESFLQHPQLRERGRLRTVETPCGPLSAFLPAVTVPGIDPVMGPVPSVGEHTASILTELGLSDGDST
ncbi:MAG TPA: CoA transferase, partial [Bradyrhizobium sp.]|nr:CoA transferase [Bradyrhizobium sp.]